MDRRGTCALTPPAGARRLDGVSPRESREKDEAPPPSGDDWQVRLAEAMQARGLSGGELARRAGFTSQYVNSLRSGERGARLPLDTARKLARALGVSVDWLTRGAGGRERLSDVFRVDGSPEGDDPYPSRAETIALLGPFAAREVLEALRRAVPPDADEDPGREFWIAYAKDLARDLKRIKDDPDLNPDAAPRSAYVPVKKRR